MYKCSVNKVAWLDVVGKIKENKAGQGRSSEKNREKANWNNWIFSPLVQLNDELWLNSLLHGAFTESRFEHLTGRFRLDIVAPAPTAVTKVTSSSAALITTATYIDTSKSGFSCTSLPR